MVRTEKRRGCIPLPGILFALLILGGIGFFVYKAQGTVISMNSHPTVVVESCTGFVHIHAGNATDKVILEGVGSTFTSYTQNQDRNILVISSCDLNLSVPANTDLIVDADSIDVFGVQGQMQLTTNGGEITVVQSVLQGKSVLDNNGGPIRFRGSLDPKGASKFSSNGGMIDIALQHDASFHLDVTGIIETVVTNFPNIAVKRSEIHADVGTAPFANLMLDVNGSTIVLKSA